MKLLVVSVILLLSVIHLTKVKAAEDDFEDLVIDDDVDLDDEVAMAVREAFAEEYDKRAPSCSCSGGSCSCCINIRIKRLGIDGDVCLEVRLSGSSVTVTLKLGNKVLYRKTFTLGSSFPGPCLRVGIGRVCLSFSDVSLNPLEACADIKARALWTNYGPYRLGCFRL